MANSTTPPKVFYEMIEALRLGQNEVPKMHNGIFRGITNVMPGYWTVVGVTKKALAQMEAAGWRGNYTKGLCRDHMKSARSFQDILLSKPHTYDEFAKLVEEYGRCVICTKEENPSRTSGYGNYYADEDVFWINEPFCTASEIAVSTNKKRTEIFRGFFNDNGL